MRFWIALIGLTGFPVLVTASPVPPADFKGAQFVDKAGCVHVRQGSDWVQRLDSAGAAICGFPPTPVAEVATEDLEGKLAEVLAEGLRDGDLVSDRQKAELRADPVPDAAQEEFGERVARQVAMNEAAKVLATGNSGPNFDLCAKLGYKPDDQQVPIIGADVTLGLCPGMRAPLPERKTTRVAAAQKTDVAPQTEGAASAAPAMAPAKPSLAAATPSKAVAGTAPQQTPSTTADRRAPTSAAAAPLVEMIPASARYVQVGAFEDEANAAIVIRKLSQRGYRVAQSHIRQDDKQLRTILAGPFGDRQTLIEALNDLRKNGYPRAVAR